MDIRTLQKWHGAGNDFLVDVTDPRTVLRWTPERARAVCDRHRGVGADGLLLAILDGDTTTMVLFNADGSTAEMSGNGIRCLAAAVRRMTRLERTEVVVTTAVGERVVHLTGPALAGRGSVDMGTVTIRLGVPDVLGLANVGNPHVVVADQETWNDRDREDLAASLVARHGAANVEFVTVLGPGRVRIGVIERGVGWTQACGTGSVATAAVLRAVDHFGDEIVVANPGGELTVRFIGDRATLEGPYAFVADIAWEAP